MGAMGFISTLGSRQAALELDFIRGRYRRQAGSVLEDKALADIVTITRNTAGGRINAQGVFEMVPAGQPRFDYDPVTLAPCALLVEEQRTNLLTYSSNFTNDAWLKTDTTPSTDGTLAPDGGPMQLLTQGSAMNGFVGRTSSVSISPGTFTASRFFKRGNHDWVRLSIAADAGGNNAGHAWFNLATGTVGSVLATGSATSVTSRIRSFGGGIYRCEVSTTLATSTANSISSGVTGDAAFTQVSGGSRYEWLGQLEAGSFASSPIPTTSSQVTRAADVASVNTLSPWFNSTSGTILVEASPPSLPAGAGTLAPYAVDIEDGSVKNRIGLYRDANTGNSGFVVTVSNANTVELNAVRSSGTLHRWAGAYATNNFALSANGGQVVTKTSGTLPLGLNRMLIGSSAIGRYWNGYIRRVRYYPRRLSNAELEALTA